MSITRSLAKDGPDIAALHSPLWREEADTPVKALGEQCPFFYTRAGAVLPLEGQYRGGHAFLMANGPSVAALDLAPLHRRWVMTLNNVNGGRCFKLQHSRNSTHMSHALTSSHPVSRCDLPCDGAWDWLR